MTAPRVLLFSDFLAPHRGGIEVHVQTLARHLQEAGLSVMIATPYPGPEEVDGVRVHRLPTPLLPHLQTIWTTHGITPYLQLLHRERVDLVHVHLSIYNPAGIPAAWLAHQAELPVVLTFHSLLSGYLRAMTLFDRLTGWTRLPFTFTAVSERVAQQLSGVLHGRSVSVLPPAFAPNEWPAVMARPGDGRFRVVSTMRLEHRKRPHALIDALAVVKSRLPAGLTLRARIIGDGSRRAALERQIAALGLSAEVELLGTRSHEGLRHEYADADLFVLPSVEESFGLAVLEARSSGLPVVIRDGGGPTMFIRDAVEGLIADSDAALAEAMLRLAGDTILRQRIARHNTERPPAFHRDDMVRMHRDLYVAASRSGE